MKKMKIHTWIDGFGERNKIRTKQPPKCCANASLPKSGTRDQKKRKIRKKARAHTHTRIHTAALFNESSHVSLTDAIDERKQKKNTSHCFSVRLCDRRCGAFLKVPISHKFAIIHSSDAILVFCRLRFIAPLARSAHMDFIALSAVHWPQFYYSWTSYERLE